MPSLLRFLAHPSQILGLCTLLGGGLLGGLAACRPPQAALVVANGPDVEILDPQLASSMAAGRVFSALFEGLTRLNPQTLDILPGLALSWHKIDDAGQVWSFTLRPNLHWSDGTPLTIEDVAASWRRLGDPATGATYAAWMRNAVLLSNPTEQSIQVHFPAPMPLFDRMCAFHALAPIPPALRNAVPGTTPKLLACSGPYRFVERRIRDRIRVEANPFSWRPTPPGYESIDFLTLDSQFTALNLFLAGDVSYVPSVPDLAIPKLQRMHADIFHSTPQFATYFLRLQIRNSPLQNLDLRLALLHAIDREELAKTLGGGRPAAQSLVPPFVKNYPAVVGPNFDLDAAHAALARYRQTHPGPLPTLEYLYPSSDFNRTLAEILQQQWAAHLGLRITLLNQEAKTFFPAQRALDYQISHSSWVGDYLDPSSFLDNFQSRSGNNRTGFENSHYDELLDWAARCGDPLLRLDLLAQAEQLLLEQGVVVPLLLDVGQELVATSVAGFSPNASAMLDWATLHPTPEVP